MPVMCVAYNIVECVCLYIVYGSQPACCSKVCLFVYRKVKDFLVYFVLNVYITVYICCLYSCCQLKQESCYADLRVYIIANQLVDWSSYNTVDPLH